MPTELKGGQVLIDSDYEWIAADYKPVTEWKGEGTFSLYTDTPKRIGGEEIITGNRLTTTDDDCGLRGGKVVHRNRRPFVSKDVDRPH